MIGYDRLSSTKVAIKHLKLPDGEVAAWALREIKALRVLSAHRHPNIVNFREVVTMRPSDANRMLGDVYTVFDAAEGDLGGLIDVEVARAAAAATAAVAAGTASSAETAALVECDLRPPFPMALVRHLMRQLLAGLAFIHSQGYVHRDIKPANLLLDRHYNLRIADFGLVKKVTRGQRLTPGMCTPWWRAPEVLLSDDNSGPLMGPAMDMWSAGVVFTVSTFLFVFVCVCACCA